MEKRKLWCRGVFLSSTLTPFSKSKNSSLNVFYLPQPYESPYTKPPILLSEKDTLEQGYTEELIRLTTIREHYTRIYIRFMGKQPHNHIKSKLVVSFDNMIFVPGKGDIIIHMDKAMSHYYSIFITRRNIDFSQPDHYFTRVLDTVKELEGLK